MAVNKHISTGKFFPSISEIKEKVSSVHWDAYTKISSNLANYLSPADYEEYKRIYEATKNYKMGVIETGIDEMTIRNSKQFLLERKEGEQK
jgi:hypothetical protein